MFEELFTIQKNPFNDLDRLTIRRIIVCFEKGFSSAWDSRRGVGYNYSGYIHIYTELIRYLYANFNRFLSLAPEIHRMTYGYAVIHILRTGKF